MNSDTKANSNGKYFVGLSFAPILYFYFLWVLITVIVFRSALKQRRSQW